MAPAFSARARSRGGRRGSPIVTERADLREQLVAAGERRVKDFDPENVAKRTREVLGLWKRERTIQKGICPGRVVVPS